jgi:hypothetical protein
MVRAGGKYSKHCYLRRYRVLSYHSVSRYVSRCDKFKFYVLFRTVHLRIILVGNQFEAQFLL